MLFLPLSLQVAVCLCSGAPWWWGAGTQLSPAPRGISIALHFTAHLFVALGSAEKEKEEETKQRKKWNPQGLKECPPGWLRERRPGSGPWGL